MTFRYYRRIESQGWQDHAKLKVNSLWRRRVKGMLSGDQNKAVIEHDHGPATTVHVFRADPTNCGDWWSLPARYFTFPSHDNVVDINDWGPDTHFAGTAILGGGGLIGPAFSHLESMLDRPEIICVGWGLGENMLDDKRSGYVSGAAALPDYVSRFRLLGIRDVIDGFRWVPCASCMHPVFSGHHEIKHEIVVFEHKRLPLGIDGLPRMTNQGNDIDAIVRFIASGKTVVTNSYHGAYWAILLGRPCVTIPFSSKFYRMKHPPHLCPHDEWRQGVDKARVYESALAESRKANVDFYADVMDLLLG